MDPTIGAAVVGGVFSIVNIPVATYAARWARKTHAVGVSNARELEVMASRLDGRQNNMIRTAVKEYVREHPGMIDAAVAHEAMRDLLTELVGLHLSPEEVDEMQRHRRG